MTINLKKIATFLSEHLARERHERKSRCLRAGGRACWLAALIVPVTLAEKGCVAPARTFAAVGITLTATCAGGVPGVFVVPEQPNCTSMSTKTSQNCARRKCLLQVFRSSGTDTNANAGQSLLQ